jgi:hypothetical protein
MGIRRRDAALVPGGILALATMHVTWGAGFIWSLATVRRTNTNG